MASKKQIRDEIFEIEDRIEPLLPKWFTIIGVGVIGLAGLVGLIAFILEFTGE